ncbi:MAG: ribosomal-processing cysteine protease Prp [Lachnospiraceae bacterium]|nr:ribosomal-processing cysteine protease Prp [Lachnospiraceae bacterium]
MIQVTVFRDPDGTYRSFRCEGHAGYADKGEDIICSAVSILVVNTVNSLEGISKDRVRTVSKSGKGYVDCEFLETPTEIGKAFMDSFIMGIRGIIKSYGDDYVNLDIKEVSRC